MKVNVGCTYVVEEDFESNGVKFLKGCEMYAWFSGELIMIAENRYFPMEPSKVIKLIEDGKLKLRLKETV